MRDSKFQPPFLNARADLGPSPLPARLLGPTAALALTLLLWPHGRCCDWQKKSCSWRWEWNTVQQWPENQRRCSTGKEREERAWGPKQHSEWGQGCTKGKEHHGRENHSVPLPSKRYSLTLLSSITYRKNREGDICWQPQPPLCHVKQFCSGPGLHAFLTLTPIPKKQLNEELFPHSQLWWFVKHLFHIACSLTEAMIKKTDFHINTFPVMS